MATIQCVRGFELLELRDADPRLHLGKGVRLWAIRSLRQVRRERGAFIGA